MGPIAMARLRRLALASAGLCTVLASPPSGAADLLAVARARGSLRMAMEGSYPPFNFVDPKTGQMSGYDADVARLLGERLGLKVELASTEWTAMLGGLATRKYDAVVSQVVITPKRQQTLDFSEPYTYSSARLILRKRDDATYTGLADLKGKTVGVPRDSIYEAQVRAMPGVKMRSYPAAPEILQDLAFGHIDAALNDSLMVAYLATHATLPIKPGPVVGTGTRIGVAFQKGNPQFKAAVDAVLLRAQADGTLATLSRKWFGVDASRPAAPAPRP